MDASTSGTVRTDAAATAGDGERLLQSPVIGLELHACKRLCSAEDLAGSLLTAPVTVPAGEVEARTLLTAAGLMLRGRVGGARKYPRAQDFSPDLDFDNLQHFCAERGRDDGLKTFSP